MEGPTAARESSKYETVSQKTTGKESVEGRCAHQNGSDESRLSRLVRRAHT